jgi:hypothetical protein
MVDHARQVLRHQQAQAQQTAPGPRVVAQSGGPKGRKLQGNLGPGSLYPGVGELVQTTRQAYYCGVMTGQAFGFVEHPNAKDAKRTSTRFVGQFLLIDHQGSVMQGAECYVPGTVERTIKAALKLRGEGPGEPVPFAIEVWCEPDQAGRPRSPLGYSYVSYDRAPQGENPVLALAYAAGFLEPPQASLPAPLPAEADPETGEIGPDPAEAA